MGMAGEQGREHDGRQHDREHDLGSSGALSVGSLARPAKPGRAPRSPRRRRVGVVSVVVVALLVVGGVVGVARAQSARGPVALVRDYVGLVASGRASEAAAVVTPTDTAAGHADPALLTDAVLDRATQRIVVVSVEQDALAEPAGEVPVGGTTTVTVTYRLGDAQATVDLRVRRLPDELSLQHWGLVDALVVPFRASSTVPSFTSATLGGAKVPLSGPKSEDFPLARPVLVYPGVYPLVPPASPWVTAPTASVRVIHGDTLADGVGQNIRYAATPALLAKVNAEARPWLVACAAAGKAADPRCPQELGFEDGPVTVVSVPRITGIGTYQTDYRGPGDWDPLLRFFSADGSYALPGGGGRHPFSLNGWVHISPDGATARVEFVRSF